MLLPLLYQMITLSGSKTMVTEVLITMTSFVLASQEIMIEPLGVTLFTNDYGEFSFDHSGSQSLTFSVELTPIFPFSSTSNPITLDPLSDTDLTLEFGVAKEFPEFDVFVDIYPNGNGFLCNDWSNHIICYRNMGNVAIDGIVELEYDPLFQGHAEVTPIDSVNGNTVYMSFENLLPGQMFFYDVDLLTPTVDFIGEYIASYARVTGFYQGQEVAYGEQTLEMEIACAYDPNDKQAFPIGYTDDHLLLQETEQEFLIRFQNTGNAPAQDIRIQDTLDGICDAFEVPGCTSPDACNYDEHATDDDASCDFDSCFGCMELSASNYNPDATMDDGSCIFLNILGCAAEINEDGFVNTSDLLLLMAEYGMECAN